MKLRNTFIAGAMLLVFSNMSVATPIMFTEDFSGNTLSSGGFLLDGNTMADEELRLNGRNYFRTVNEYVASIDTPVTMAFTMRFLSQDIFFIGMRSSDTPQDNNNEPSDGIILRSHNFDGGNTGIGGNFITNDYRVFRPTQGDSFYGLNTPIRMEFTDFGDRIDVNMRNLSTNWTFDFSYENTFTAGGYYGLSALNASVDDLTFSYTPSNNTATNVSEPMGAALFGLGVFGLAMARKKAKNK